MDIKEVEKIMGENKELKKLLAQKPQLRPQEKIENIRNDIVLKEKIMLGVALNEKVFFDVVIDERNIFQRLTGKKNHIYYVRRHINLEKTIKITQKLLEIPEFIVEGKSISEILYKNIETIANHTKKVVKIIGILFNTANYNFLRKNLGNKDMLKIIVAMFDMINHEDFMTTMGTLRSKASLISE